LNAYVAGLWADVRVRNESKARFDRLPFTVFPDKQTDIFRVRRHVSRVPVFNCAMGCTFEASVADEMRKRAGISDQQVDELYGSDPHPKGPENWRWVHAVVRAIDKYGFGMSGKTIEAIMRDVYLYANRGGVRNQIDHIVNTLLTEEPTIVVGHSLGSVVAYNVLRTDTRKLQVPLFITVGCPLALRAIRDQFVPIGFPKPPVQGWSNAFDIRDIVALYPLDATNFPVNPAALPELLVQEGIEIGITGFEPAEIDLLHLDFGAQTRGVKAPLSRTQTASFSALLLMPTTHRRGGAMGD
jgi:hypothetical protein